MRIITGKVRGHKLITPKDWDIRPTSDRVKGSIFNIIQDYLYDAIVVDLFSGTGNLGIEALSRGAKKAYFIDANKESINIIRKNLYNTNLNDMAEIIHDDVIFAINKLAIKNVQADIIFIDPPYKQGLSQRALQDIAKKNILNDLGIIIVEHDKSEKLPEQIESLIKFRKKDYGSTGVSFYEEREEK